MYEATEAADHEPAMGQSSSSADGMSVSQNQDVSDNVAALEPAALQEVCVKTHCRSEEAVAAWLYSCCVSWDLMTNFLLQLFEILVHFVHLAVPLHSSVTSA